MKRLLVILSLAALAGATSGAGVRSATSGLERSASNTEGAVVFASSRDGDFDLYAVNTDGTGLTQLTNDPFDEEEPLPSPDGRHILFDSGDGLNVVEADGSGRRSFPGCSTSPEAWSSDSRHVVCTRYEGGIVILDTMDGTVTPLADAGSRPSWSPDGTTIAFLDEYKLYVIPAVGGTRQRLGVRKLAQFAAPAWSPDSQRLAYVSVEANDRYSLWTISSRWLRRAAGCAEGLGGHTQLVAGRLSHRLHERARQRCRCARHGSRRRQRPAPGERHSRRRVDPASCMVGRRARALRARSLPRVAGVGHLRRATDRPRRPGVDASVPGRRDEHRPTVDHRPSSRWRGGASADRDRSFQEEDQLRHADRMDGNGRYPGGAQARHRPSSAADDLERCDRAGSTRSESLRRPLRAGIPRARGQSARLDMCRSRQHVLRSGAQNGACG